MTGAKVRVLGFSSDGRRLLTACDDAFVVWDVKSGKEIARFRLEGKPAYRAAIVPDGQTVVATFWGEKAILLFDVASGRLSSRIPQPQDVVGLTLSPDGKSVASYYFKNLVYLWDIETGKELRRMQLRATRGWTAWAFETGHTLSPDGKLVAVPLGDSSVQLCDMATGADVHRLFRPADIHFAAEVAFSPDGRHLAVHSQERVQNEDERDIRRSLIRLWDIRTGEIVREFRRPDPPHRPHPRHQSEWADYRNEIGWWSHGMRFSPDGKTLVSASIFRTQLWEVASRQLRHEFNVSTCTPCFSPNGAFLAAVIADTTRDGPKPIVLWNWRDLCLKQREALGQRDIDRLWDGLASVDAAVGYRTMATLIAQPEFAVSLLEKRLKRIEPAPSAEIDGLITKLDDDDFAIREGASKRLTELGGSARAALLRMKAQRTSPELRRRIEELLARPILPIPSDQLRCLRAVEVLESIGTKGARQIIRNLASESGRTIEVEDARAALKRLEAR